jgi:hypothetical protein
MHSFRKFWTALQKMFGAVAFLTSDYERRVGDQPLMNTNQRKLAWSRDELPGFAFIRVRLGKGINDFPLKAPALTNARPSTETASARHLETAVLQGCLSLQSS